MSTVAIISAMEGEIAPLVRDWPVRRFTHEGRTFRVRGQGDFVAIAGGIGRAAATRAANAVMAQYHPQMLVSVGVAGALERELKVGTLFIPSVIVDSLSNIQYRTGLGAGVLVTASQVVDNSAKQQLHHQFQAQAVDMEAAAVVEAARIQGAQFRCVKAISDELDFEMPPLNRFVDAEGRFHTGRFVAWAAFRPRRWPSILQLARNTAKASAALCEWLSYADRMELRP